MKLFRRKPEKHVPPHHARAMGHVRSAVSALQHGDEMGFKSNLGHALRAFSKQGQTQQTMSPTQPMPSEGMEP